jgi:hypothetical protein
MTLFDDRAAGRKTASRSHAVAPRFWPALSAAVLLLASTACVCAQTASIAIKPPPPAAAAVKPAVKPDAAKPATAKLASVPAPSDLPPGVTLPANTGPMTLLLRGLDKITGRPTNIVAPVGGAVHFATLTITARYCYSTPASETPETAAFVQIQDHRPDQTERSVFSGWMYASSPGLNAMEHPLYDVWVISCSAAAPGTAPPGAMVSTAPVKVLAPDSSDKEQTEALPVEAGR